MVGIRQKRIRDRLSPQGVSLLAALASGLALSGAYFSQYVLGWSPCQLCLWQRVPHWSILGLGLAGFILLKWQPRLARVILPALSLIFLAGAGIASYHAGVEYGWWAGLASCAAMDISSAQSTADFLAALQGAVPCNRPVWLIEGWITMAGANALFSVCMAVILMIYLIKTRRKRPPYAG